jgi:CBS domain-containing protein
MKCADVMTSNPAYSLPTDNVEQAAQLMRDEDVGSIPVVGSEAQHEVVGIVTDRDITTKVVAEGRDPRTTRISDVMTRDPFACGPDDDVDKAIDAMEEHQVRRMLVTDKNRRLLGIIAQADVATRANQDKKTAELVREISR